MMYVTQLEKIKEQNLDAEIERLLEARPDFKKIFRRESLAVYVVVGRLLQNLSVENLGLCTVLPSGGPDEGDFLSVQAFPETGIEAHYRKVFSPKSHLYFTNSLVAGQLAIDHGFKGSVQTLNADGHSLDQIFSYARLRIMTDPLENLVVGFSNGKEAFAFLFTSRAASDSHRIQDINDFYQLQGACE